MQLNLTVGRKAMKSLAKDRLVEPYAVPEYHVSGAGVIEHVDDHSMRLLMVQEETLPGDTAKSNVVKCELSIERDKLRILRDEIDEVLKR